MPSPQTPAWRRELRAKGALHAELVAELEALRPQLDALILMAIEDGDSYKSLRDLCGFKTVESIRRIRLRAGAPAPRGGWARRNESDRR